MILARNVRSETLLGKKYNNIEPKTLEDIIGFHHDVELIHPFQDGNGRVGRLIMFKECLENIVVPFIINRFEIVLLLGDARIEK